MNVALLLLLDPYCFPGRVPIYRLSVFARPASKLRAFIIPRAAAYTLSTRTKWKLGNQRIGRRTSGFANVSVWNQYVYRTTQNQRVCHGARLCHSSRSIVPVEIMPGRRTIRIIYNKR